MKNKKAILVIHGGAGTILKKNMTPEKEQAYEDMLKKSLMAGYAILKDSGKSLNAVAASIEVMENSPLFNAGKGAVFTHNETNELDASIMDGKSLKAGAVCGVSTVKNPIQVALDILNNSEHVLLSGKGAEAYASDNGLEIVDPDYFFDSVRFEQLKRVQRTDRSALDHDSEIGDSSEIEFNLNINPDQKFGTVGAVALDLHGDLAAGTSTGGMTNKRYGRVGDSPLIGSGTYASNKTCAVSCTGHGEFFIRYNVAHDMHARMAYRGLSVEEAAKEILFGEMLSAGGSGGLIALDAKGNFCTTFNTAGMYRGILYDDGSVEVGIYGEK